MRSPNRKGRGASALGWCRTIGVATEENVTPGRQWTRRRGPAEGAFSPSPRASRPNISKLRAPALAAEYRQSTWGRMDRRAPPDETRAGLGYTAGPVASAQGRAMIDAIGGRRTRRLLNTET